MSEVYNSLPRPFNSNGVVLVKPPESTSATVSVPSSDQTASTCSVPESARASTSTNSACANTAQLRLHLKQIKCLWTHGMQTLPGSRGGIPNYLAQYSCRLCLISPSHISTSESSMYQNEYTSGRLS